MVIRVSYQSRALFRKCATLQLRQKGTNICQIFTPILCLLVIYILKVVIETALANHTFKVYELETYPRFLNPPIMPNYLMYNLMGLDVVDCEQWYYYDYESENEETEKFIGQLNGYYSTQNPGYNLGREGMLGEIPNFLCNENGRRNPYFIRPNNTINQDIYHALKEINKLKISEDKEVKNIEYLPDGAVTFYAANSTMLDYKAQINDQRFSSYHRNNGVTKIRVTNTTLKNILPVTDGLLGLIDMIHNSYFKRIFRSTEIITLVQYLPITYNQEEEMQRVINVIGGSLYPLALSLLLPVFMHSIVLEKEERLQEFMKMNGMRMRNYWVVNFLFNFMVYGLTVGVFVLFGVYLTEIEFFTQTSSVVMWAILASWGLAQVSLAFFFQVFIDKARSATVVGYFLAMGVVMWGVMLNFMISPLPNELPWLYKWYPQFAICRALYILSFNCAYYKCVDSVSEMPYELIECCAAMFIVGSAFCLLAIYLNEIMPKTYGVPRHPLFCIRRKSSKPSSTELTSFSPELMGEDESVKSERDKVFSLSPPYTSYPLLIKELRKQYSTSSGFKTAVKQLSLCIQEGELFGLLGPNGAGKTTLISLLTGLYEANGGNAWIGGYDIIHELDQVHLNLGVCPQFDILWPELTIYEHLLFYARLKGTQPSEEHTMVRKAMEDVFLTKFGSLKSSELSGGMRRRLSVAIALVGNPKMVFLDEPTTGLDPENRRQLWDILAKCREGRAMVLTTHSMEEADVLCSRIGIINQGVLRCIGRQTTLKSQYGGGYHLFLNCLRENDSSLQSVKSFIKDLLPESTLTSEFLNNLAYQVPISKHKLSYIFQEIERNKLKMGIEDWGISQSSLEDVFLKVIEEEC